VKLLVVEDSPKLLRSLEHGLTKLGWAVDLAADGAQALSRLRSHEYDVVVLDLMLPRVTGLEVLRLMREEGRDAHVLILSAKDRVEDRVEGLRLGADDYLTKPFAFEELEARLQSLLRRRHASKNPVLRLGDLEVDTSLRRVLLAGEVVHLTPSEHALLELLVLRRGQVFSQGQLLDHLRSSDADVSSNVIEVLVSSLRRKIHRPGAPPIVKTRRGFGYFVE
jgi:DNA-binding response OmpR family regulator